MLIMVLYCGKHRANVESFSKSVVVHAFHNVGLLSITDMTYSAASTDGVAALDIQRITQLRSKPMPRVIIDTNGTHYVLATVEINLELQLAVLVKALHIFVQQNMQGKFSQ